VWKICQDKGPENRQEWQNKEDFKPKLIRREKEGHFILRKGAIHQEYNTVIDSYAPNVCAPNCIKHKLMDLKLQIDPNTVIVGDFNTPLLPIDCHLDNQKRNSKIE
jgi:hypothetical protein